MYNQSVQHDNKEQCIVQKASVGCMVRGWSLGEGVGFSWPNPTSMLQDDAPTTLLWFGITIFVAFARLWGVVRLEKRGKGGEGRGREKYKKYIYHFLTRTLSCLLQNNGRQGNTFILNLYN